MELPDRFIHQTTRYVLGRMTYAVEEHCKWLIVNWKNIPEPEKIIIQSDIEEAFRRGTGLGMDIDRQCWEEVRKLWIIS